MSLLTKAGISRLSELQIDADKGWNGKGISSLKELALNMQRGDIIYRGLSGLVKLTPGPIGFELTSNGPGHEVEWKAPPGG